MRSLFESKLSFFFIVKVQDAIADDLIRLVALACDNDYLVVRGAVGRGLDRGAAVGDRFVFSAAHPADDLVDDRLRPFAARVVARDDDAVGEPRGDLPHLRPLSFVAIAAAAEEEDDTGTGRELPHGAQQLL